MRYLVLRALPSVLEAFTNDIACKLERPRAVTKAHKLAVEHAVHALMTCPERWEDCALSLWVTLGKHLEECQYQVRDAKQQLDAFNLHQALWKGLFPRPAHNHPTWMKYVAHDQLPCV